MVFLALVPCHFSFPVYRIVPADARTAGDGERKGEREEGGGGRS
jgi:hypothetical protein